MLGDSLRLVLRCVICRKFSEISCFGLGFVVWDYWCDVKGIGCLVLFRVVMVWWDSIVVVLKELDVL